MALRLDDLAALDGPMPSATGLPLLLPLQAIDEDPSQPRREFDSNALQELALTIKERGIRQPISVRPNLQQPGRWVLNFGARRLRAAKLAGLTEVPAFIDNTADDYDQVIENEQREGLRPLDLALFVQKRLALGDTQAEIAKRLGKSRQYVTVATALIEPPDWLLQAYRQGRCKGKNELYELRRLHGLHPGVVEQWAGEGGAITRERIAQLRQMVAQASPVEEALTKSPTAPAHALLRSVPDSAPVAVTTAKPSATSPEISPAPQPNRPVPTDLRVHVEHEGQDHQLVVSAAPKQAGCVYVQPLAGGPRRMVLASELKLRGFVNGGNVASRGRVVNLSDKTASGLQGGPPPV